jgi:RNA-directed DNA polymerase
MMNGGEKSDPIIVAVKPANGTERSGKESGEPRVGTEGNAIEDAALRTPSREGASNGLDRVRATARAKKEEKFTALLHHITVAALEEAFFATRKDAAPGVDAMTWQDYEKDLARKLADLHGRVHAGAYRALPGRRVYIPKPDGGQRPLAVAALEDKIVQRATATVLQAIYEEDFLGLSYGFRPGRGAHDALDALCAGIKHGRVNFILDADIEKFFDSVSHEWLIKFVEHRVGDRRIVRLIRKWLRAGIVEEGVRSRSHRGTGQGSAISPLLANIYLHYVFDLWAHRWRQREAEGNVIIVRYADDIIVGFERENDALRFLEDMRKRLESFALNLHPKKTRLIEFGRYAHERRRARGQDKPETFDFLGFTFLCSRSRRGAFLIKRKPRVDRMRTKLAEIGEGLRQRMHRPIAEQGGWLARIVAGWDNYFAVPTASRWLERFRRAILIRWRRALKRRSQKDRTTWDRMARLQDEFIPKPQILHDWPERRFAAKHPRWEPYAGKPHVRFCAGGAP